MAIISANQVTRMGMAGGIWQPQGSYAGKVPAVALVKPPYIGLIANPGTLMNR